MNEDLIYKFADQANYSNLACSYDDLDIVKFAELIVNECISIVDKYGDSDEGNNIAYQIGKHFGIDGW